MRPRVLRDRPRRARNACTPAGRIARRRRRQRSRRGAVGRLRHRGFESSGLTRGASGARGRQSRWPTDPSRPRPRQGCVGGLLGCNASRGADRPRHDARRGTRRPACPTRRRRGAPGQRRCHRRRRHSPGRLGPPAPGRRKSSGPQDGSRVAQLRTTPRSAIRPSCSRDVTRAGEGHVSPRRAGGTELSGVIPACLPSIVAIPPGPGGPLHGVGGVDPPLLTVKDSGVPLTLAHRSIHAPCSPEGVAQAPGSPVRHP